MEQTIGKRIAANRKRLGLTQDQLADRLDVTAQAVSKWENDQSCPDIMMLPKLAEIFGISTDEILGIEPSDVVHEGIVEDRTDAEQESEGIHFQNKNFEFRYESGRAGSIAMAAWVLLVGGLLLLSEFKNWDVGFWELLWPSGLLTYGIFRILTHFSFLGLGCGLIGTYYLLSNLGFPPFDMGKALLFPILLLLFGASLLVDALRKKKEPVIRVKNRKGKHGNSKRFHRECHVEGESFSSSVSFGDERSYISLPRLSGGQADVSFGELIVDLSGCEKVSEGCRINANCAFGELIFLVPSRYLVQSSKSTAFASFETEGHPDSTPAGIIYMKADASFGAIIVRYI